MKLSVPKEFLRGVVQDEERAIDSAAWRIAHMCEHLGRADLADADVLDMGCGVKFTQAFLERNLPVRRYVGIDVYPEMIDFLQREVHDPRFTYHHLNAHNELYNPGGEPLRPETPLPIDGEQFDVICLFSVFTHLAPHDAAAMLGLLRRYVTQDGRLFFTAFLDERTAGGHGLMDQWATLLAGTSGDAVAVHAEEHPEDAGPIDTFRDLDPSRPLLWAVYAKRYLHALAEEAGWRVLEISDPEPEMQHHVVCAPA